MTSAASTGGDDELPTSASSLDRWAAAIAAPTAAPGGGAAAALAMTLAAALVEMVAGLTARRGRDAAVHDQVRGAAGRGAEIRVESLALARADAVAFAGFERALALPRDTEIQRAERERAKRAAYREGARIQHELLRRSEETAGLAFALSRRGLASAAGDAATALFLAAAAGRSAAAAVRANVGGETDDEALRLLRGSAGVLARIEELERRAEESPGDPGRAVRRR